MMGRWRHGGPTCEICPSIDVRRWHREGRLQPGQHFLYSWTCGGKPWGSITVRTEWDAVVLMFKIQASQDGEGKSIEQRVPIAWTACHLGGRRPWFRCTVYSAGRYCGRRVASRCCTGPLSYSLAGVAIVWPIQANEKPCATVGLERHRKSAFDWEGAGTYLTIFRTSRRACTGRPTFVCGVLAKSPQPAQE
jgi:hypothetical protein